MKRMHLKRSKKFNKINLFLIVLIMLIIAVIYLLKLFSEKALPIFIEYSKLEVKRVASLVINNSIMNEVGINITLDDLFAIKQDNDGNIVSMDINSSEANKLLKKANETIECNFKYLEIGEINKLKMNDLSINSTKKGVIYELPSGVIFDNIFLNNLFPKIPVKLNLVGTIFSKLTTDVESYGINNAIFKVNMYVSSELKVVLPFTSDTIKVETTIPIVIKILEGDVPSYYFSNI